MAVVLREGGALEDGKPTRQVFMRKEAGIDDDKTKPKGNGLGRFSPRLLIKKAKVAEAMKEGGILKDETVDSE
ncbi:MAG: hypothetical protein AAB907_02750 [Patescibacteria group bacterium]